MCGIVCYIGAGDGVAHVVNALDLLTYRAPDSSGLTVVDAEGRMAVRRAVGTSKQLQDRLENDPLPPLAGNQPRIVAGHGRWAMVGAVTETNAHPLADRSGARVICENGSHDASLMLGAMQEQEQWWRARGLPAGEAVHRSENTSEVLVCEWERNRIMLDEGVHSPEWPAMLSKLAEAGITDREEIALRLAVHRLQPGNAHACAFYSAHRPETLFVTSHHKPVAIIARRHADGSTSWMVASDINAGLMLWTPAEVGRAAENGEQFTVQVIFLDHTLAGGRRLFVRLDITPLAPGPFTPVLRLSTYSGRPLTSEWKSIELNPAMTGKRGFASFTESHIDEIPDVLAGIIFHYMRNGVVSLAGTKPAGLLVGPGLDADLINQRFGRGLPHLRRVLLIGEGSSWRDAQCAAPLFRQLLPGVLVNVFRPVAFLNLGPALDPQHDLAVEISWSGTTDGVLKADAWLHELGVLRIIVTGRPQSDLGRRGLAAAGTLDVMTGVEVSVATVKGFAAILLILDFLALQLAAWQETPGTEVTAQQVQKEIAENIATHVRSTIGDQQRRQCLRELARQLCGYNKVVVAGNSPVDLEGELKIEELAWVVAAAVDLHSAGLRCLVERSALAAHDVQRILFIVNATTPEAQRAARPVLSYLHEQGVSAVVHTTPHPDLLEWQAQDNLAVFVSPAVSPALQPLIDAPFFFDLAVALAYGRGLSADQIDRPRNLAKSVTTTGANRRSAVESRPIFSQSSLPDFAPAGQDESLTPPASNALPAFLAALAGQIRAAIQPYVIAGYDKVQIIGGGQDFIGAQSIAHALCLQGIMAEALYTDSAWHGPLAAVGGPGPEWDALIVILATDPLFQAAALVDTQVYRARNAQVILVVPVGNGDRPDVRGVDAGAVLAVPAGPRSALPIIHAAWGSTFAAEYANGLANGPADFYRHSS